MADSIITFQQAVQSHIEKKDDGSLRFKLSPEAVAALNKQQTFSNISTSGATMTAKEVDYAKAIEQLANPAESQATYDIVADEIHFMNPMDGKEVSTPCTVAKVTNICTSQITDATVTKLYGGCQYQKGRQSADLKTSIRSDSSISGLDMFTKAEESPIVDRVVKRTGLYDTGVSATISQEDIKQLDYLRQLVVLQQHVKQTMVAEYLSSIKGGSDAVILAAYKNINRSTIDSIFTAVYAKNFGSVDPKDASAAHDYFQTYQDFQDALLAEFPYSMAAETIQFGLSARKMTISPSPIWTNMDKLNHVKQFNGGSYFVTSNIDLGIMRIPTNSKIMADHMEQIITLVRAAMLFIENEARLQAGYGIAEANVNLFQFEAPKSLEYYDILGLSQQQQQQYIDEMQRLASKTANDVCTNRVERKRNDTLASINNIFGNKS